MTLNTSPKTQGEPSIEAIASGLGTLGRYGDNYMVHAAEGETIVPREILEANPGLKEDLFRQMTMMGIENPNRYVVGDQLNSINPITGQPEFFFKKIFRAIKKVVKKAAPIIVPMLGNAILPGIGGLLASGLYTKAQGGSWGDALKSAAMSWGAQGLMSGIGNLQSGTGTFFEGVGKGLSAPFDAAGNLFSSGPLNPINQGIFGQNPVSGSVTNLVPEYDPTRGADAQAFKNMGIETAPNPVAAPVAAVPPRGITGYDYLNNPDVTANEALAPNFVEGFIEPAPPPLDGFVDTVGYDPTIPSVTPRAASGSSSAVAPKPGAGATFKIKPGQTANDFTPGDKVTSGDKTYIVKQGPTKDGSGLTNTFVEAPSGIGKFYQENIRGPVANIVGDKAATPVILGGGALLASAFSKDPPPPPPNASEKEMAAYRAYLAEYAANPNMSDDRHRYLRGLSGIIPQFSRSQVASIIQRDVRGIPGYRFVGAGGGEVMGPGTGTSDSIPARLSDGEFVMTARAVRNAGGGDRSLGAARMYDMMNRFEQGAA
tara:strand:- start:2826 stop:4451 length:1626 start_codon:yes stop_codon:yes gene_type:complete